MLDKEAVDKCADILGSAIATLFDEGVELAAASFDDVEVVKARLNSIRHLADDALILVAALAIIIRRTEGATTVSKILRENVARESRLHTDGSNPRAGWC